MHFPPFFVPALMLPLERHRREWTDDGQLWVQYVSSTPATRLDVTNLQEQLDQKLQQRQARETGICPVREELYSQCFGEGWLARGGAAVLYLICTLLLVALHSSTVICAASRSCSHDFALTISPPINRAPIKIKKAVTRADNVLLSSTAYTVRMSGFTWLQTPAVI